MLSLAFDRKHRVLLATVSGIFTSDDLDEFDRAVLDFVAREGRVWAIIDYTPVLALAVPGTRLTQRVQQPLVLPDRILVAPRDLGDTARAYSLQQGEAGMKQPTVVETIEEAYALLGLRNPRFEPIER
jgi:hypothetical protein